VGRPRVVDSADAPMTTTALAAKMQKLASETAKNGGAGPAVDDLDVWAFVVRAGVRNGDDAQTAHLQLVACAQEHCGEAMVHCLIECTVHPRMIDDVWMTEDIDEYVSVARRSRLSVLSAARQSQCACGGAFLAFVVRCLIQNSAPVAELCRDAPAALTRG
ncbi:unnamed protein product, partial [Prorocentrum cordatum]